MIITQRSVYSQSYLGPEHQPRNRSLLWDTGHGYSRTLRSGRGYASRWFLVRFPPETHLPRRNASFLFRNMPPKLPHRFKWSSFNSPSIANRISSAMNVGNCIIAVVSERDVRVSAWALTETIIQLGFILISLTPFRKEEHHFCFSMCHSGESEDDAKTNCLGQR